MTQRTESGLTMTDVLKREIILDRLRMRRTKPEKRTTAEAKELALRVRAMERLFTYLSV